MLITECCPKYTFDIMNVSVFGKKKKVEVSQKPIYSFSFDQSSKGLESLSNCHQDRYRGYIFQWGHVLW